MEPTRLPYDVLWDVFNEMDYFGGDAWKDACSLWQEAWNDSDPCAVRRLDPSPHFISTVFCEACKAGDLRAIAYLYRVHSGILRWSLRTFVDGEGCPASVGRVVALWAACSENNVRVARWLTDAGVVKPKDTYAWNHVLLSNACSNGRLDVARYLYETFDVKRSDIAMCGFDAFLHACGNGCLDVVQWLHATFRLTDQEARVENNAPFRWACSNGHLKVAKWLWATFDLVGNHADPRFPACREALDYGKPHIAEWIMKEVGATSPLQMYSQ